MQREFNTPLGLLLAALMALGAAGCVRFHDRPLSATKSGDDLESRSLTNTALKGYIEKNLHRELSGWPARSWDFDMLTLAALYYNPSLDTARAQWGVAKATKVTAGERPNPTLNLLPGYDTTTSIPSPWLPFGTLDIPIETMGKRGYRIAEADHISEAARLNVAAVAWQVRSAVRARLVELTAALMAEKLLEDQEHLQTDYLKLLTSQREAGAVSEYTITQAAISADNTRFALRDAEQQSAAARAQLAGTIGLPLAALDSLEFSSEGLDQVPVDLSASAVRRQALLNRSDILSALANYAAAQSALKLDIAKQYPDIHLGPGYEYNQGDSQWFLGLTVTLPVLNQNQGGIAEAEARRIRSAAEFNALQARVIAEIDQATAVYHVALKKKADADALKGRLQTQEKISQTMFNAGEISRSELVGIRLQLNASALSRLDAITKWQQAIGALEDALQSPATLLPVSEESPRPSTEAKASALPKLVQTILLPRVKGGFDLMAIDLSGKRLFLDAEDNNTTEVIDLSAGRLAHTITNMNEPKWVVYRPELHRLYVANGDGAVRVLDSDSFKPLHTIRFREKANNLHFDPKTRELFVGVGKTFGAIGIVDTRTDRITAEIPLASYPKQFELDGNRIYVNVPEANHVAVIDRKKKAVVATWPVTAAKENVPMDFDRSGHRLFLGCESGKLVVLNSETGGQVDVLDIAPEPDGVHYDAQRKQIYASCGEGFLDVLKQKYPDHYETVGRIPTAKGAATSLFVPQLNEIFLAVPQAGNQTAQLRVYSLK